jgi:tRNA-2-methylthio-N6-dimethylallyladenosine synthase
MRRTYNQQRYLDRVALIREHVPDCALTTDIIVGFPGETEEDFQETLRVVEEARFATAFTFQYSIRPGTPAAAMPDQVSKAVVQERYERLQALQDRISWEENQKIVGREVELLVANGEGRKDADTHRLSGRAADSRLVHFDVPDGSPVPRPGDMVTVTVTQAAPFHLIADSTDGAPLRIRRTIAGDAWDRAQADSCAVPSPTGNAAGGPVSLGLPSLRLRSGATTIPIYDVTDGQR